MTLFVVINIHVFYMKISHIIIIKECMLTRRVLLHRLNSTAVFTMLC